MKETTRADLLRFIQDGPPWALDILTDMVNTIEWDLKTLPSDPLAEAKHLYLGTTRKEYSPALIEISYPIERKNTSKLALIRCSVTKITNELTQIAIFTTIAAIEVNLSVKPTKECSTI